MVQYISSVGRNKRLISRREQEKMSETKRKIDRRESTSIILPTFSTSILCFLAKSSSSRTLIGEKLSNPIDFLIMALTMLLSSKKTTFENSGRLDLQKNGGLKNFPFVLEKLNCESSFVK